MHNLKGVYCLIMVSLISGCANPLIVSGVLSVGQSIDSHIEMIKLETRIENLERENFIKTCC